MNLNLLSSTPPPLLGALPKGAGFDQVFLYQLAAMAVVMISLVALWLISEFVAVGFRRAAEKTLRGEGGPQEEEETSPEMEEHARLTAVIAAAVVTVLGGQVRIRRIEGVTPSQPANPQLAAWTLQGRLQHHTSHHVR